MGPAFAFLPVRFGGRLFGRQAASIGLDNYMTDPATADTVNGRALTGRNLPL
jgi:hypothetical protein